MWMSPFGLVNIERGYVPKTNWSRLGYQEYVVAARKFKQDPSYFPPPIHAWRDEDMAGWERQALDGMLPLAPCEEAEDRAFA